MKLICIALFLFPTTQLLAQKIKLEPTDLKPLDVVITEVKYGGKKCIRMVGSKERRHFDEIAIVRSTSFKNGTIEVELSGDRLPDSDPSYRGFVGIAFRLQEVDSTREYECFYLRPTNGRSDDQLRRNHSTQYVSEPGFPWQKLRKENPGEYESYVDLVPGEWTKIKIIVKEQRAWLYVNNFSQPCLIVNDLKRVAKTGKLALWIGAGTVAHFRNLKIVND